MYTVDLPYGTYYSNDLSNFENLEKTIYNFNHSYWGSDNTNLKYLACFSGYFNWYRGDSNMPFYFYFPDLMHWADKYIEEINSLVNNFKYVIYKTTYGKLATPGSSHLTFIDKDEYDTLPNNLKALGLVVGIEFSPKYKSHSLMYLNFVLHHTIRLSSWKEKYVELSDVDLTGNYLDCIISRNNQKNNKDASSIYPGGKYRCLCENDISKSDWLLLDNPEVVNAVYEGFRNEIKKQTESICKLREYADPGKSAYESNKLLFNDDNQIFVYLNDHLYHLADLNKRDEIAALHGNVYPISYKGNPTLYKLPRPQNILDKIIRRLNYTQINVKDWYDKFIIPISGCPNVELESYTVDHMYKIYLKGTYQHLSYSAYQELEDILHTNRRIKYYTEHKITAHSKILVYDSTMYFRDERSATSAMDLVNKVLKLTDNKFITPILKTADEKTQYYLIEYL